MPQAALLDGLSLGAVSFGWNGLVQFLIIFITPVSVEY
jgi:hypothetical protein